jgi:iron complex transport system substrate-binding protein
MRWLLRGSSSLIGGVADASRRARPKLPPADGVSVWHGAGVRIASLVPSATEMLYALGLGDAVVGVTHECDFPPEAVRKPVLTRSVIPDGLPPVEVDRAVSERTQRGESLYELDRARLEGLRPDLIVTQAVCEVCAVSYDDVRALAARLPGAPRVLSLDPSTLGEVLSGIRELGATTGAEAAAERLLRGAADRIDAVRRAVSGAKRPRVAALEWLDPPWVGGHWVPAQIELAGGEDPYGFAGERSRRVSWDELRAGRPEFAVVMPCGYALEAAREGAESFRGPLALLGAERVVAVDASAYFSRPGPRLVDGIELLGHVLHPDRIPAPPPGRFADVPLAAAAAH